jgi:hypothetical protein
VAKRLISEGCVRDMAAGGELVVGPHDIVTPAALELAFARGIRVRWSDEAPAAGGTPTVGSSLWTSVLAADGNYVVEVKNGRARVFRLTASGPTLVGEGA